MLVFVHLAEWLVDLDERAVWQPADDAGLDPVVEDVVVMALQGNAHR